MELKKEAEKKPEEDKKEMPQKGKKSCICKNNNFPLGFGFGFLVMGLITALLVSYVLVPNLKKDEGVDTSLGLEKAKTKIESFINEVLIGDNGEKITVKESSEESGLYKIVVTTSTGQDVETYVTKDGKLFFDRTMNIAEIEKEKQAASSEAPQNQEVIKSDKPIIEVFVMSHCPYGTQIEKGVLPVAEALGDKIDFELKFCDYAMHGETELNEQLQQHCIKTEEPAKFTAYLECFLEAGDSKSCLTKAKINTSKINSCVSVTDKKYSVTANFKDKSTWKGNYPTFNVYKEDNAKYNVGGSPTLVINGATISSGRDSASLLATICSGFNNPPEECSTELSLETPSPGFGSATTTGGGDDASCN